MATTLTGITAAFKLSAGNNSQGLPKYVSASFGATLNPSTYDEAKLKAIATAFDTEGIFDLPIVWANVKQTSRIEI